MTARARRILAIARRHGAPGLLGALQEKFERPSLVAAYAEWVRRHDTLDEAERERLDQQASALPFRPLISVLMPVCDPPLAALEAALESVRAQIYDNWQLCIADDASEAPHVRPLLERFAAIEPRCALKLLPARGHVCRASNAALAMATGEWIALLDHDDTLVPQALFRIAEAISRNPDAQLVYSDEDKLDAHGQRIDPHFKTGWNEALLLAQNYVSHLAAYRTGTVRSLGGFREGLEGAQDYDLALRMSERAGSRAIVHIPHVLYHWRVSAQSTASSAAAKGYAQAAATRTVREHLERKGVAADVAPSGIATYHRIHYKLPEPAPRISILVTAASERAAQPGPLIAALRARTDYPDLDIQVLPAKGSPAVNAAAHSALCPLICILHADLIPLDPDWLVEMAGHAVQPGVGPVGPKLLYRDGRVALATYALAEDGAILRPFAGLLEDDPGPFGHAGLAQDAGAVSTACMLIRRQAFLDVGGLDTHAPFGVPSAIDLCLRLRASGQIARWTPNAVLRWRQPPRSQSQRSAAVPADLARRWRELLGPHAYLPAVDLSAQ